MDGELSGRGMGRNVKGEVTKHRDAVLLRTIPLIKLLSQTSGM